MKKEFSNLLKKYWLIACESSELKNKQIKQIHLVDIPIVLFKSKNQVAALLDFCPHRNAPLSKGSVVDDHIQCPYHGWKFSKDGICKDIPGLCDNSDIKAQMKTKSFNCKEELGYIWIQIENSENQIFKPKFIHNSNYHSFSFQTKIKSDFLNIVENFLDPFHTHFIHNKIIRTKDSQRQSVDVEIKSKNNYVELTYSNENKQLGLISQIFEKDRQSSLARFLLPSVMELEYLSKTGTEMLITVFISPTKDDLYKSYIITSIKAKGLSAMIAEFLIRLFFNIAIRQDIEILKIQNENIKQFNGEAFRSTELDFVRSRVIALFESSNNEDDCKLKIQI